MLFEVDWSNEVHRVTDGRYLLRINDGNVPFNANEIAAIKEGKRRRVVETRFIQEATLADLDIDLVHKVAERAGLKVSAEEVLVTHYRLAERREGRLILTIAALLLFAKDPVRWHPHCGIDFTHYRGSDRKVGAQLNIIKRVRIESPLVRLIEEAYQVIQSRMNEKQPLVDLFFSEGMEYPMFAWQEALINAVAHRDYRYEGNSIEVDMLDNRLEIRSPGELVEPVTLERLKRQERIHASRNPRIVRVLTDYRYMREKGEGVPRIFQEMEREGLSPPEFKMEAGVMFTVTLLNIPFYSRETMHWLSRLDDKSLSGNQKRLLAYAREHSGAITSRNYQNLVQVDLYTASKDIGHLVGRGILRLPKKGGRVYELVEHPSEAIPEKPPEYRALEPTLALKGFIQNRDIQEVLEVSLHQAGRIAARLVELGWLTPQGERKARKYTPKQ